MRKLIQREKQLDQKLSNALVGSLHDKDGEMTEQLYVRMLHSRVSSKGSSDSNNSEEPWRGFMTGLQYNLMLGSAAKFNRPDLFDQIMIESTILG